MVASERATASRCSDPSAPTTKRDPGPAVLVDDDAGDLEHLLPADVLAERVVEALEPRVPIGVGGPGARVEAGGSVFAWPRSEAHSPPRGQGVDLGPRDARLARRLVVQVQAVGAVVELRHSQAQELGEAAVDPQVRRVPERIARPSAPCRSAPRSHSRRAGGSPPGHRQPILLPFNAHRSSRLVPRRRAPRASARSSSVTA